MATHSKPTFANTSVIFDPVAMTVANTSTSMVTARYAVASLLSNGQIFVGGGWNGDHLMTAELFE